MKRTLILTALGVTTAAVGLLFWELRPVVLLFALALAIAAAVRPVIDALVARGVSRGLALLGVYGLTVSIAGAAIYFLGVELVGELRRGGDQLLAAYESLRGEWVADAGWRGRLSQALPPTETFTPNIGLGGISTVAGGAMDATMGFLNLLGSVVLVLVLALYWDAYRRDTLRFWLGLLRPEWRGGVRDLWISTLRNVGERMRSDLGQSLITLGICSLVFRSMGMSYWVLPSCAVALARLFPFVGVLFGTAAAALAGGVDGPIVAALAGAVALCVHVVLEHLVSRRILHRKPSNPVILILAAMVLTSAFGVGGLVLAPLVTAALQPVLESTLSLRATGRTPARDLDELCGRVDALKQRTEGRAASPELANLMTRLDTLLATVRADR